MNRKLVAITGALMLSLGACTLIMLRTMTRARVSLKQ
jgi:hypothetical protein